MVEAKEEKKWEIEDAARTLIRAEEIRKDEKLFKSAIAEVKRQREAANAALNISGSNMED